MSKLDEIIIKRYKATSPGIRGRVIVLDRSISKSTTNKFFFRALNRKKFRNSNGNLVSYHRSFGNKKLYRIIDFKRIFFDFNAKVVNFEYDPNRNVSIALIQYENGTFSYILKNEGLKKGSIVKSSLKLEPMINIGDNLKLSNIPVGTIISNISEKHVHSNGKYLRAAGMYGQLVLKKDGTNLVLFSSGRKKFFDDESTATIGIISGSQKKFVNIGKAGANRWLGKRPHVRGVAMNPIDHPHGGGNGKSSGGRPSVSRWGKYTKGVVKKK